MVNRLPSTADLLAREMPSTPPAAKFPNLGDRIYGTIFSAKVEPQYNFETGRPVLRQGKPQLQIVVTLIDSAGDYFNLYVRLNSNLFLACKEALSAAGRRDFVAGDTIEVIFSDEEPNENPEINPAKIYTVKIAKGAAK